MSIARALKLGDSNQIKIESEKLINKTENLIFDYEISTEGTNDFGGLPARYVDIFPVAESLATDHKKFGGIFLRCWTFGNPERLTYGLFMGAERAEQSEPRRGVSYLRRRLTRHLSAFEETHNFGYHTWTSTNFPWTTKSSRAVARQLEQFISFREDILDEGNFSSIDERILSCLLLLDAAVSTLLPIEQTGKDIIELYYGENLPEPSSLISSESEGQLPPFTYSKSLITSSLLAKPFLILTGPSGTGKTRGAIQLAEQLCSTGASALVAIGADWTDNRHVLGYLNPLDQNEESGLPIYETTPILDLVRHANDCPEEPHVLILDEMNLSHVERYFADFLSAMELPDKEDAIKLHSAAEAVDRSGKPVPCKINFPENLFVIGTVNIDETTYMFSPKVLDRANVIEIHADETAVGNLLRGIPAVSASESVHDYGISFLEAAQAIREEETNAQVPDLPTPIRNAASDELMKFFNMLKKARCEFGYRSSREIIAYLRAAHFLAGSTENGREVWLQEGWRNSLDEQVLQKILPKLHGSRSRLGPLLGALATLAATGEEALAMKHFPKDGNPAERSPRDAQGLADTKLPKSYEKLDQMIGILLEEQFVSFIS